MATKRPWRCHRCGGWSHEVGQISRTGLCAPCGTAAVEAHNNAIASKSGPIYEAWLQACAKERELRERTRGTLYAPRDP